MVSNEDLKIRNFETIEEYYQHIIDSKINGQRNQAQALYHKMSSAQKDNFLKQTLEEYSSNSVLQLISYLNQD